MSNLAIAAVIVAVLILDLAVAIGWTLRKRPLWLWNLGTRQALRKAGLKQVRVDSPTGPQSLFVGGSGPPLALLHGAGDQAGTWAKAAPALIKRHTLIIPDLAGHGDSAPAQGPIEIAAVVAGLEAVLASQAQGRPLILLGNSLGAWMAMVLAHRHPEWVAQVIAVNGGPMAGASPVQLLPASREEARATMAQLRDPGSPAMPDYVLDDMVRQRTSSSLARFAGTAATMGAWLLDETQLATLRMPVRLLWGGADQMMTLDYARRLQAALPDAQLITIDRCGHVPQQEAPGRFLEALAKVLPESAQ